MFWFCQRDQDYLLAVSNLEGNYQNTKCQNIKIPKKGKHVCICLSLFAYYVFRFFDDFCIPLFQTNVGYIFEYISRAYFFTQAFKPLSRGRLGHFSGKGPNENQFSYLFLIFDIWKAPIWWSISGFVSHRRTQEYTFGRNLIIFQIVSETNFHKLCPIFSFLCSLHSHQLLARSLLEGTKTLFRSARTSWNIFGSSSVRLPQQICIICTALSIPGSCSTGDFYHTNTKIKTTLQHVLCFQRT